MSMKFYWFNDTNKTVRVTAGPDTKTFSVIEPQTGDYLEIGMPEGKCLFIKQWDNGIVFVGHIDQET